MISEVIILGKERQKKNEGNWEHTQKMKAKVEIKNTHNWRYWKKADTKHQQNLI